MCTAIIQFALVFWKHVNCSILIRETQQGTEKKCMPIV